MKPLLTQWAAAAEKVGGEHDDVYRTPATVRAPLMKLLRFDLDTAADAQNALTPRFYDEAVNGLTQPWDGRSVWCNPPYGRQDSPTSLWLQKGRWTAQTLGNRVTMLVPIKADTIWYHDLVWGSNQVEQSSILTGPIPGRWYQLREQWGFVELLERRGRLVFEGDSPGWFASALVVFNAGRRPLLPQLTRGA